MAVVGIAQLSGSAAVHHPLSWLWPPALLVLVVWVLLRVGRQLRSRTRRWLLYPVLAVLGIASVGGGYETVGESLDAKAYPMPGQLVDVGGYRLHLHCTGSGSPTVVLQPGQGGFPRTSRGSRLRWRGTAQSASMTAPVEGGATPPTVRRTVTR
jgi:hypothetical protein